MSTTEQTMALKAVAQAVAHLRATDYHATADWLETAVIALADECDQQRTRAEAAEQELADARRNDADRRSQEQFDRVTHEVDDAN